MLLKYEFELYWNDINFEYNLYISLQILLKNKYFKIRSKYLISNFITKIII